MLTTEQFIEKYEPCEDAALWLRTQSDLAAAWMENWRLLIEKEIEHGQ
jgi:hypothetical protein